MRTKLLIILILPFLLLQCKSTIWNMITKKESKLYSNIEKLILTDTTASIDFKYGFDPDLEIDYVYKAGNFSEKEISAKAPEMKKALGKYKPEEVISFYEKVVQLKETQIWKMNYLTKREKWVNSTFIKKYTLPESEQFLDILEKNVVQINSAYGGTIDQRKIELKMIVAHRLQKELDDAEKRLRERQRPPWK